MIEIKNLQKSFGQHHVIKGIDLTIDKGEVLCLIGGSGSGKSTMLQCINGLHSIDDGKVLVDEINVFDKATDLNKLREKIGIVFQQYNAFPHLSAIENVALSPRVVKGMKRKDTLDLAAKHLEHVGLGDKLNHYPSQLSGGQQQRLAIARALAMEPEYMLFDEVTSALDPELVGEVLDTMRMLKDEGMTMIIVTHEIPFAREASDRVAFFDQGKICEIGDARQVINDPRELRTRQFLERVLH
ncbi:amino acid ABC transporter ATP-binding protein [Pseudovibrio sp. JE062]|uniref:amino acid ABC transporter ATP-binding protein n=1 Tax=Pseudovibrio sp. JE062 TaxID=439495 RepID=UPI000186C058|nr:amino acid ABC transporter ATP-binding protein [Pseudovibrio sp. JE062]EEA95049.1 ABC transporter, nucleotide binding/ATPase protein (amino acid) [Pseudovibrio sp. JE062]